VVTSILDNPRAPLSTTPWGPASELRSRQLRPGPGNVPAAVARNQRERLYGATVATVAEYGYESTRVADILQVAGVSRSAFYRHFDNKLECFLATLDAIAKLAGGPMAGFFYDDGTRTWHERLEAVFDGLVEMILAQPAAARIWLIEIHAAGPPAVDRMERLTDQLADFATNVIGETSDRPGMPAEGVRAMLGGLRQIIHTRLRHDREQELPQLVPDLLEWALGYGAPPARLRKPRKSPHLPMPTPDPDEQRRRILTSIANLAAEQGYQEMTITEISQRAAVSLSTFYNHFDSKQTAFMAALDEAERQVVEVTLPFYQQGSDWPHAARDVIHAFFAFNATHPELSQLGGLRIFSGGGQGLDRHEVATTRFGAVLHGGYRERPDVSPIVSEAISGSIAALVYQQIRRHGAERLYEFAGIASFIALAPFIGSDEACRLANEGWHPVSA
jgi:AcrR family transcriptional regulator